MKYVVSFFLVSLIGLSFSNEARSQPKKSAQVLTLDQLLLGLSNHPKMKGAQQEILQAQAQQQQARGGFDPKLKAKGFLHPLAKDYALFDVSLIHPLALWGTDVVVGWRTGMGSVPVYKLEADSANALGEFYAGINLPLWRNRLIDKRRTDRTLANLALEQANVTRQEDRLALGQKAIKAYTGWLVSGWLVTVEQTRLRLLSGRLKALMVGIREGDKAKIDRLDMARAIASQKAQVLKTQQNFFKTQAELSLYLRDNQGKPLMASVARLPKPTLDMVPKQRTEKQWRKRIAQHPAWRKYQIDAKMIQIKHRLASESTKPRLDLQPQIVQSVGPGAWGLAQKENEVAVGLVFEMYFSQNKARGKMAQLSAKRRQVRFKQQQAFETIWASVLTNQNALAQTQKQVMLLKEAWQLARQVEKLERTKMALGEGSWFLINARERKTIETYRKLINVHQKALYYRYFLALLWQIPGPSSK